MTTTMPADLPPASRAWLSDRPGWCVDRGPTLEAMTTCDLWLALARGDVTPQTKVWREGMPHWDQVANVPEFALAMPDASVWEPEPASAVRPARARAVESAPAPDEAAREDGDAAQQRMLALVDEVLRPMTEANDAHDAGDAHDGRGSAARVVEVATMAPPGDLVTPEPVAVDEIPTVPPPSRSRRRGLAKIDRASALSALIGALLAVAALAFATAGPPRTDAAPGAGAPARGVELGAAPTVRETRADTKLEASVRAQPPAAPAAKPPASAEPASPPRGPHAADRGQKRARAGTTDPRR